LHKQIYLWAIRINQLGHNRPIHLPGEPGGFGAREAFGEIMEGYGGDLRQTVVVGQVVLRLPGGLVGPIGQRQIQPELRVVQHLAASRIEFVEPQGGIIRWADSSLVGHNRWGNHQPRNGIACRRKQLLVVCKIKRNFPRPGVPWFLKMKMEKEKTCCMAKCWKL